MIKMKSGKIEKQETERTTKREGGEEKVMDKK